MKVKVITAREDGNPVHAWRARMIAPHRGVGLWMIAEQPGYDIITSSRAGRVGSPPPRVIRPAGPVAGISVAIIPRPVRIWKLDTARTRGQPKKIKISHAVIFYECIQVHSPSLFDRIAVDPMLRSGVVVGEGDLQGGGQAEQHQPGTELNDLSFHGRIRILG